MKKFFSFDFWQKFGKALLVVVAVMPAAGIMISLGKLVAMTGGDITAVQTIARVMEEGLDKRPRLQRDPEPNGQTGDPPTSTASECHPANTPV